MEMLKGRAIASFMLCAHNKTKITNAQRVCRNIEDIIDNYFLFEDAKNNGKVPKLITTAITPKTPTAV